MLDCVEPFYIGPIFFHPYGKVIDYCLMNDIGFFAIHCFMSTFHFNEFLYRIEINIICFYMMTMAKQDQIVVGSPFVVRLMGIVTFPSRIGGLYVAHLGNKLVFLVYQWMTTRREGTCIARVSE